MKRWIHNSEDIKNYPDSSEIDRLVRSDDPFAVEDMYYNECINAIGEGLKGESYESDSYGISIFDEDGDVVVSLSNGEIGDMEKEALKNSSSWPEFHKSLSSALNSMRNPLRR